MATYRLSVSVAKRSSGRSATAMAAYRAGELVTDLRTGRVYDYRRKSGVLYVEIFAPNDAPEWAFNRAELWNRSEEAERKGNAVIAREIQLSLPHELTNAERYELTAIFARHISRDTASRLMPVSTRRAAAATSATITRTCFSANGNSTPRRRRD